MENVTKKHTIYLTAKKIGGKYSYGIEMVDMSEYGYITVETKEIEVSMDVPEGYDPVNGHIDALRDEKQKIGAEAQVKINNIEDQIQSLLAIECDS